MLKKILKTFFAILFFLFISNILTPTAQAQENPGLSAQVWRCLAARDPDGHRRPPDTLDVVLSGRGFPTLQDIYIVYCVPTTRSNERDEIPGTFNCTTGNSESDQRIFGTDRTGRVSMTIEVPVGTTPPQTVQAPGGNLVTTVMLHGVTGHRYYSFFGVTVSPPRVIPGQGSTIQYGTFDFIQDPVTEGCLSIRWDPYGRVFDSQSLEPISNVVVTLLDENRQFVNLPGLTNPERTEVDGAYNFFVDIAGQDPQTFYLNPVKSTHTFSADPNLNPNYSRAYYDIYRPGEPIIEAPGNPEHRDVPMDPGSNPPFRSDPVSVTATSVRLGNWTRFEGTVSHPLSTIKLVGEVTGTEVASIRADREGFWTTFISNRNIPQDESLRLEIIKEDLTLLSRKPGINLLTDSLNKLFSLISRGAYAQPAAVSNESIKFKPILTYVEGFAKDQKGNLMPNASVKVKLEMSDGVYFETVADENAFFTIQPEYLPIFSYYLEFTSPTTGVSVKSNTLEFVKNNQEHLAANSVNLMAATKNGESLIPTEPADENPLPKDTASSNSKLNLFAGSGFSWILTLIALVVLIAVTGGVLMYIKKKKSGSDDLL